MNTKLISAIAFKLFAIYAVFSAIIAIPSIAGSFIAIKRQAFGFEATIFWPVVISVITIIVTFIAFKILWKLGNSIIESMSNINESDHNFDLLGFEKTIFIFLGTYFTISALVTLPTVASTLWERNMAPSGITISDYAWLTSVIAQLILGLSLIKKIDSWLSFVRGLGAK